MIKAHLIDSSGTIFSINNGQLVFDGALPLKSIHSMLFNQLKGNPCLILLSAEIESGAGKYGARAWRFACLEAGHLAEALLREAALAGFGCCPIGGFDDHAFEEIVTSIDGLNLPLYIIAVGLKA